MRRIIAKILTIGMIFSLLVPGGGKQAEAAKKPKLNRKSVTVKVGESVTLKVKNKKKKAKVSWKSKKKSIATVTKKGKVKGKKKGNTKIICRVKQGKKTYKLACKVKVAAVKKKVPSESQTPAQSSVPGGNVLPVQTGQPNAPAQTGGPHVPEQSSEVPHPTVPFVPPTDPPVTYHPDWPSEYSDEFLPLKELAKSFKVGSAIAGSSEEYAAIHDADMSGILQKHYNTTTLTNLMKPVFLLDQEASQKTEDGMPAVSFESCEKELKFCQDTGISLRGHVLVWYNQTPDWFFYEDYDEDGKLADKETMKKRMESYIKQVITYVQENYPGVVYCWDVVNEAVEEDGSMRKNNNLWYTTYAQGDETYEEYEYVKDAFTYAKKYVNPDVALVYNDYNTFKPDKRAGILNMIEYVNQEGTLIDTMGMQCPLLPEWPFIKGTDEIDRNEEACVQYAIEDFAQAKLDLMITELCVRTEGGNSRQEIENQAARYKEMYQLLYDMDKENGGPAQITSVTTFGISDSYRLYSESSWRPGDESRYAWLFDRNCKAKMGFQCVYNVFAAAAGKPTVEEKYEKPEGDDTKMCILKGKMLNKDGTPIVHEYVRFESEEDSSYAVTDENGAYSVSLLNGTYEVWTNFKNMGTVNITNSSPEIIEFDIQMDVQLYRVYATVQSKNGEPLAVQFSDFSVWNENEEVTYSSSVLLSDKGETELYMPAGVWKVRVGENEVTITDENRDYTAEEPLKVVMPQNLYRIHGKIDIGGIVPDGQNVYLYLNNMKTGERNYLMPDEDNNYSVLVPDGESIMIGSWSEGDDEIEEGSLPKCYHFVFGQREIKDSMQWDLLESDLHRVQIQSENEVAVRSIYANGLDCSPMYGGSLYVAKSPAVLTGEFIEVAEAETAPVLYSFEASCDWEGEKEEGSDFVIDKAVKKEEVSVLEDGQSVTLTDEPCDWSEDMYQTFKYFAFRPEKSGTYTVSVNHTEAEEDKNAYKEVSLDLWDSKLYYLSGKYFDSGLTGEVQVEFEAGKWYFISADFIYEKLQKSKDVSFHIKQEA